MLRLKEVLTQLGSNQKALAEHLQLSKATVAQLINHNQWPKTLPRPALESSINHFLEERGAKLSDLPRVFDEIAPVAADVIDCPKEAEIMLLAKQALLPDTRKTFGLFRDPFTDDVQEADDVFTSSDIRYVREAMFQTARHGGFMAIVGESGAGKTTLRRDLIDRISRESQPIVVAEPYVLGLEENDIKGKSLKASHIAESILAAVAPLENPKRSPEARFQQIHRVLKESRRAGHSHVLIIEEAHGLAIPTIKHLKRFFELEDGFKKLLGIVLIGQPELKLKLSERNHELREVVQRCELVELAPLDSRLEEYLTFKLARVGKKLGDVITADGLDVMRIRLQATRNSGKERVSLMYPLAVNNLLTACMNLAASLGADVVNADFVKGV